MKFLPIHPSVLDVYFQTLRMNELGAALDKCDEQEVPVELRLEIDNAAHVLVVAEKKALDILGSRERLNQELTRLHSKRGLS